MTRAPRHPHSFPSVIRARVLSAGCQLQKRRLRHQPAPRPAFRAQDAARRHTSGLDKPKQHTRSLRGMGSVRPPRLLSLYFCNNFTRYNPNANLFAFAQGVVEFSSTSSLIPNYKIRVVNLYRWGRNTSYVGVVLELVVFAYISFFFITETRQVLRIGITAYAPFTPIPNSVFSTI
jgi:hypothetical protein